MLSFIRGATVHMEVSSFCAFVRVAAVVTDRAEMGGRSSDLQTRSVSHRGARDGPLTGDPGVDSAEKWHSLPRE